MLLFLATVLEQLDLALDHVRKGDVHNARIGLMLTDNAIELVLHQIAIDKARELRTYSYLKKEYPYGTELDKALGRSFEAKVKFAKLHGVLSNREAHAILTMHDYRNEVYHIGLQHEAILPALATFYFEFSCNVLAKFEPSSLWWGSNLVLPERAKKYFSGDRHFPGKREDFAKACKTLATEANHDPSTTIESLADHMDQVVEEIDTCIDILAGGIYERQRTTRAEAIIRTQAWPLAFTDAGKKFAATNGWTSGSVFQFVEWLASKYPFQFKVDPIPSWKKRAGALRLDKDAASALTRYTSFMNETAEIRAALYEAAGQVEAEIDNLINQARGK